MGFNSLTADKHALPYKDIKDFNLADAIKPLSQVLPELRNFLAEELPATQTNNKEGSRELFLRTFEVVEPVLVLAGALSLRDDAKGPSIFDRLKPTFFAVVAYLSVWVTAKFFYLPDFSESAPDGFSVLAVSSGVICSVLYAVLAAMACRKAVEARYDAERARNVLEESTVLKELLKKSELDNYDRKKFEQLCVQLTEVLRCLSYVRMGSGERGNLARAVESSLVALGALES